MVSTDGEVSFWAGVVTGAMVVSLPNTTPSVDSPGGCKSVMLFTTSSVESSGVVGSMACPFPLMLLESVG